jgi:hypothetical protein
MQFDISVGVQNGNDRLLKEIDQILERRSGDIHKLLANYHVPVVESGS